MSKDLFFYFSTVIKHDITVIVQFVEVFREFCKDGSSAFLYLNTLDLNNRSTEYKKMLFHLIITMIENSYQSFNESKKEYLKNFISFDDACKILEKEKLKDRLIKGESFIFFTNANDQNKNYTQQLEEQGIIFLVSSYAHLSSGQNIQYTFKGIEKDFDGIFLGSVTNIITTDLKKIAFDNHQREQAILEVLFDISVLKNSNTITRSQAMAFYKKLLSYQRAPIIHSQTSEYYNSIMKVLIQSIGRLHRTDNECLLNICFCSAHIDVLANYNLEENIILPAVKEAIIKSKKIYNKQKDIESNIEEKVKDRAFDAKAQIKFLLDMFNKRDNPERYKDAIFEYKESKKILLSNPTTDVITYLNPEYIDNGGFNIYYKTEDDFKDIEIRIKPELGFTAVSKEGARLDVLEKILELEECFKIYNIETNWNKKYVMNPIVFNNLYKGELGETIGKYILEKYCNIELYEIDENSNIRFEAFDFTNKDESSFIDFKYYSTFTAKNTRIDQDSDFLNNIKTKIELENLHKSNIYIINVMVSEINKHQFSPRLEKIDNIHFIPWLIKEENGVAAIDFDMIGKIQDRLCW